MSSRRLLVANRGEIAIRILRAAAELDIETIAIHSEDDAASLHTRMADRTHALQGKGVAAYLDAEQIVGAAKDCGAEFIHPGYGFLAENAEFARACGAAELTFVGPDPETLDLFGDKTAARALAARTNVPTLPGTEGPTSLDDAREFLDGLPAGQAMMVKALAGGGGRGTRAVHDAAALADTFALCAAEAGQAFGNDALYVERLIEGARHVEVQVIGDGTGAVSHLGERDCSIQRRYQKIVEIAPSPWLDPKLRERLVEAAVRLAEAADYRSLGTVEFLVEGDDFYFIETNARLQVEHTVTEEVTGIDLVQAQIEVAAGRSLAELGLTQDEVPDPRGHAIQLRVNMERMTADGDARPSGGTLSAFEVPSGPGVRVDSFGYAGYTTSPSFDSLLAKLIVHSTTPRFEDALRKAGRALAEFKISGVDTNQAFLANIIRHPKFVAGEAHTRFIDGHAADLLAAESETGSERYFTDAPARGLVGTKLDSSDPLAVLDHGKSADAILESNTAAGADAPDGTIAVPAPMQGTIVSIDVAVGDAIHVGQQLLIMEAMKMQHVIEAEIGGYLRNLVVGEGDTVFEDHPLLFIEPADVDRPDEDEDENIDLDALRPDLQEVEARQAMRLDSERPDAVARRERTNQRTARLNVIDLCDEDSFIEYGSLVLAARRMRYDMDELIRKTPADGLIAGMGRVNGDLFDDEAARTMIMSYDYTVLAGTQGKKNHQKKDRMFELAEKWRLPMVFFTEGGGGRPGDTDVIFSANLHTPAFHLFGRLSGLVPLVGITSGRCFAGNAVLLGCCDVVIATADSTIGMGGPAMIEGGGLGVFRPEEVGPMSVMRANGVVDIAVEDEAEAVQAAKRYLSYFQGTLQDWDCADQRLLRRVIPEDRLRIYDVRKVIELMADKDSVLELRKDFGLGMVTSLIRIEGRPIGLIANNPSHLAGAIDSDGADKAAHFMQICDAYDIPLVSLCDTPGNMVGPEAEKTALVRHCCRLYVIAANVTVPLFTVVLRKGYGLGAQAMAAGGFHAPFFVISWPTGEFGGMGLEGAVKLGYRDKLQAIEDPDERMAEYERMVAAMYAQGKAINAASLFELDNVIDPAETRRWIIEGLRASPPPEKRSGKKHAWVDTW